MKFTLGTFHFRIHPSGLDAKNLELQLPLIPVLRWFVTLILALACILLHTVGETSEVTFARQVSNGRQEEQETGIKKGNLHLSQNNVPRNLFNAFTGEEWRERWGNGVKERQKEERDKRSHSDENAAAATFPVKGGRQEVCRLAD